ncbi:MAG: hypothetical protein JWO48_3135 [Bryobacterales bacterium]|nr:hypothetical protein [Bryobacterales bacterium]
MLVETSPDNFDGTTGETVRIIHKSSSAGTNQAAFRYARKVVPGQTFHTPGGDLHGCEFVLQPGTNVFKALCAFAPASPPTARYDFFELVSDGSLNPLESVVFGNDPSDPTLLLVLNGVAATRGLTAAVGASKKAARKKVPKP